MTRTILILSALLLGGGITTAAELHVGQGQQYGDLPSAVLAAQAGDTVVIHPGEYVGPTKIKIPLTIRGESGAVLSGKGLDLETPRAVLEFWPEASGSTVEGLAIRDGGNVPNRNAAGIRLIGTKNVTIRDCAFTGNDNGLFASGSIENLVVERCEFRDNGTATTSHNVYLSGGLDAQFIRCKFVGTLHGQNLKSRVRNLKVISCLLQDSKNRELDLVESDSTNDGGEVWIVECRIVKRWVEKRGDEYWYAPNQSRRPANLQVIQLGRDGPPGSDNTQTLYLIRNEIVTPYDQPVVRLSTAGARVLSIGNHVLRPFGASEVPPKQPLEQWFTDRPDQVSGWSNAMSISFQDGGKWSEEP